MTVRVENGSNLLFGPMGAAVTVSHFRLKQGSTTIVTKALTSSVNVLANRSFEFAEGAIDLVFNEGDATVAGLKAIVDEWFDGTRSFEVELMTSSSAEVTTSGYSSQNTADWDVSTE